MIVSTGRTVSATAGAAWSGVERSGVERRAADSRGFRKQTEEVMKDEFPGPESEAEAPGKTRRKTTSCLPGQDLQNKRYTQASAALLAVFTCDLERSPEQESPTGREPNPNQTSVWREGARLFSVVF